MTQMWSNICCRPIRGTCRQILARWSGDARPPLWRDSDSTAPQGFLRYNPEGQSGRNAREEAVNLWQRWGYVCLDAFWRKEASSSATAVGNRHEEAAPYHGLLDFDSNVDAVVSSCVKTSHDCGFDHIGVIALDKLEMVALLKHWTRWRRSWVDFGAQHTVLLDCPAPTHERSIRLPPSAVPLSLSKICMGTSGTSRFSRWQPSKWQWGHWCFCGWGSASASGAAKCRLQSLHVDKTW